MDQAVTIPTGTHSLKNGIYSCDGYGNTGYCSGNGNTMLSGADIAVVYVLFLVLFATSVVSVAGSVAWWLTRIRLSNHYNILLKVVVTTIVLPAVALFVVLLQSALTAPDAGSSGYTYEKYHDIFNQTFMAIPYYYLLFTDVAALIFVAILYLRSFGKLHSMRTPIKVASIAFLVALTSLVLYTQFRFQ